MLAKLWKKVLLAICIIACIFNIMSKLVNRTSLEANLKSANDGNVVFDIFSKKEDDVDIESNSNVSNKISEEENKVEEQVISEPEEINEVDNEKEENKSSEGVKFTDFIIEF